MSGLYLSPRTDLPSTTLTGRGYNTVAEVPAGFAAPRDIDGGQVFLTAAAQTSGTTLSVRVAVTQGSNVERQYVYKTGYMSKGGNWVQFNFSNATVGTSKWILGEASGQFEYGTVPSTAREEHVIVYVCKKYPTRPSFYCGAAGLTSPTQTAWTIQNYTAGGTVCTSDCTVTGAKRCHPTDATTIQECQMGTAGCRQWTNSTVCTGANEVCIDLECTAVQLCSSGANQTCATTQPSHSTLNTSGYCTQDRGCYKCNAGYRLNASNQCEPVAVTTYTCESGANQTCSTTAITNAATNSTGTCAPNTPTKICYKCNSGYFLSGAQCLPVSTPTCAAGQSCAGGVCACTSGSSCLNGQCAANCQATNTEFCAASGSVTGATAVTPAKYCTGTDTCLACGTGTIRCTNLATSACVNNATDNNNCGSCGTVCSNGKTCQAGLCKCPSGQTDCSGVCKTTQTDNLNCGTCGTPCSTTSTCKIATCTAGACSITNKIDGTPCSGGTCSDGNCQSAPTCTGTTYFCSETTVTGATAVPSKTCAIGDGACYQCNSNYVHCSANPVGMRLDWCCAGTSTDAACDYTSGTCKTTPPQCTVPSDCGNDPCKTYTCTAGVCSSTNKADTTTCTGTDPCKDYKCTAGACGVSGNKANGATCTTSTIPSGTCQAGVCTAATACGVHNGLQCPNEPKCIEGAGDPCGANSPGNGWCYYFCTTCAEKQNYEITMGKIGAADTEQRWTCVPPGVGVLAPKTWTKCGKNNDRWCTTPNDIAQPTSCDVSGAAVKLQYKSFKSGLNWDDRTATLGYGFCCGSTQCASESGCVNYGAYTSPVDGRANQFMCGSARMLYECKAETLGLWAADKRCGYRCVSGARVYEWGINDNPTGC